MKKTLIMLVCMIVGFIVIGILKQSQRPRQFDEGKVTTTPNRSSSQLPTQITPSPSFQQVIPQAHTPYQSLPTQSYNQTYSTFSSQQVIPQTHTFYQTFPSQIGTFSPSDIVYVTQTGSRYHRYGCRYLSRSSIPISRSQAVASGYEPCSVCNP